MNPSEQPINNRVASSQLISIDLESMYTPGQRSLIDLKNFLFQELILREKDFRDQIKGINWSQYQGHFVAIHCSVEAIVPTWAYMLLSISLQPFARKIVFGSLFQLEESIFQDAINQIDWSQYQGAKVVIKGCSKIEVPTSAYVEVSNRLCCIASSIMFGEPCSTVPLFKKSKS